MSALRVIGSGLSCAVFAGLGGYVGAEIAGRVRGAETVGAILGGAAGAFLVGALNSARCAQPIVAITTTPPTTGQLSNPRWP